MSKSRLSLMANHNRSWIWGRNAVLEMLRAGHWKAVELWYSERCEPEVLGEVITLASQRGIDAISVSDKEIEKHCHAEDHQGLAARMPAFPYMTVDQLVRNAPDKPVFVMLDRVHDSFNFGAIIRSGDVLGIDGVIIGTREQAPVNSLVARSSAGAVNHVSIAQTDDLLRTIAELHAGGFQIVGTSDRATETVFDPDFRLPTLLLIGNEGFGIQPAIESLCSRMVRIPVLGHVGSLNAAVSAGILFYEVLRQRKD